MQAIQTQTTTAYICRIGTTKLQLLTQLTLSKLIYYTKPKPLRLLKPISFCCSFDQPFSSVSLDHVLCISETFSEI